MRIVVRLDFQERPTSRTRTVRARRLRNPCLCDSGGDLWKLGLMIDRVGPARMGNPRGGGCDRRCWEFCGSKIEGSWLERRRCYTWGRRWFWRWHFHLSWNGDWHRNRGVMERRANGEVGCRWARYWVVVMTYVGEFTSVGLPETLCVTATEVHGGVVCREVDVPGPPIIEGFLDSSSYRSGLLCTLVPPGG